MQSRMFIRNHGDAHFLVLADPEVWWGHLSLFIPLIRSPLVSGDGGLIWSDAG